MFLLFFRKQDMDSQLYCERHLTDAAQSSKKEERIDEKVSELGDQVSPVWRHAAVANEMGLTLVQGRAEVFVCTGFEKTMQLWYVAVRLP